MIKTLKIAGKVLDQPLLVSKFKKSVPKLFIGGSIAYGCREVYNTPKEDRAEKSVNISCVLASTAASALMAPRIASKIVNKPYERYLAKDIIKKNTLAVDSFMKTSVGKKTDSLTAELLNKSKSQILNYKEIKKLDKEINKTKTGKELFNTLIPEPENITSKDILSEIGRLSIFGAIPVIGGIFGGIVGEKITKGELSKEKTADRVKEGAYQYLANIFMCNIGAAGALGVMEKFNIKSKTARVVGMVSGITATGIIGGSAIANFIGKKVINPIFDKDKTKSAGRKPELLDICLHSDDIATIAVMSGLKWIEPALPILYGISGYRAGIGYRNKKIGQTES